MSKTQTFKIRETEFNIEETAVPLLESYLDSVRQHFIESKDGVEIIGDIETRIAEKASKLIKDSKETLTKTQIEDILKEIGSVKDMDSDGIIGEATQKATFSTAAARTGRKIAAFAVRSLGILLILGSLSGILMLCIWLFSSLVNPGFAVAVVPFSRIDLRQLSDYNLLAVLFFLGTLAAALIVMELGIVLTLMKNVIKVIPTVVLIAIVILTTASIFAVSIHDYNTDNIAARNTRQLVNIKL
jgi:hypothetical protein